MNPAARTNQLLYQVELLLDQAVGSDEHAVARRMALEEAALGQLELALDALMREVTGHADVALDGWRAWLSSTVSLAELSRLRGLADAPESWLAVLISRLEELHGDEGAARREGRRDLIASASAPPLGEQLGWFHREFKALLPSLREGSLEW